MSASTTRQIGGVLLKPDATPFANSSLTIYRDKREVVPQGDAAIVDEVLRTVTGPGGEVSMALVPGKYLGQIRLSDADRYFQFTVPDGAGPFVIADLIETSPISGAQYLTLLDLVTTARAWAEKPEDEEVVENGYSALHWAAKAEEARAGAADAVEHAKEWAQSEDPISPEAGGDGVTDRSAKWWAGQSEQIAFPDRFIPEIKLNRRLSARIGAMFDTVADLLSDTTLTYDDVSVGDIIEAQGFRYEVAASDATDAHVKTAGGVKLVYIFDDVVFVNALGAPFDGSSGDDFLATALHIADGRKVIIPKIGSGLRVTGSPDWSAYKINLGGDGVLDLGPQQGLSEKRVRVGSLLKISDLTVKGGGVQFHSLDQDVDVDFTSAKFVGHSVVFEARGTSKVNSFNMKDCFVSKLAAGSRDGSQDVFFNTTTTFRDVVITGNRFVNGGRQALLLMSALSDDPGQRAIIADNIFHDYMLPEVTGNTDAQFIRVYGHSVTITGNVFSEMNWHDGGPTPTDVEGIYVQAVDGLIISGNTFRNAGCAEGNIVAKAGGKNIIINGNTFINTPEYKARLAAAGTGDIAFIALASAESVSIINNHFNGAYNRVVKAADGGNMDKVRIEGNTFQNCEIISEFFRFRNLNTVFLSIKDNVFWDGNVLVDSGSFILHTAANCKTIIEGNDFSSLSADEKILINNPVDATILSRGNRYPKCRRIIGLAGYRYARFENDSFVQESGAQQNIFGSGTELLGLEVVNCAFKLLAVGGSNRLFSLPIVSDSNHPTAIASLSYEMWLEDESNEYCFRWTGDMVRSGGSWAEPVNTSERNVGSGSATPLSPNIASTSIFLRAPSGFSFVSGTVIVNYRHKTKGTAWH